MLNAIINGTLKEQNNLAMETKLKISCGCVNCARVSNQIRKAGLLVIDNKNMAKFLYRRIPYPKKKDKNNCVDDNNEMEYYWEKIQVPRGIKKYNTECLLSCAIREFFEETGCILNGKCYLYNRPFILSWLSNNINYKYAIFIIFIENFDINTIVDKNHLILDVNLKKYDGVLKNEKTFHYDLISKNKSSYKAVFYELMHLYPINISLTMYFKFMKQILKDNKHVKNNYELFFDYILRVKHMYTYYPLNFTIINFK
ncbi:MAG: nudix Ac38 [Cotesia congregata filamentous virus 2]